MVKRKKFKGKKLEREGRREWNEEKQVSMWKAALPP